MPIQRPSAPARAAAAAALLALTLAACKSTPFLGSPTTKADAAPGGEAPPQSPAPLAATPELSGLPTPPPGAKTSDRGDRLARPTPVGQIAPEVLPPVVTPR